MSTTRWLNA